MRASTGGIAVAIGSMFLAACGGDLGDGSGSRWPLPPQSSPDNQNRAAPGVGSGGAGPAGVGESRGGLEVSVGWTYPALITDQERGLVFPSYAAHLLGRSIRSSFPTDLVCMSLTNHGSPISGTLLVKFAVYAEDATQNLMIPAGQSHACVTPAFDFGKLYALRDVAPGRIEVQLLVGSSVVSAEMKDLSIAPPTDIAWAMPGVSPADMNALAAVFVTPKDPKVDQLQRLAAATSRFGGFGGVDSYQRNPYLRSEDMTPGQFAGERLYVESGEPVSWLISSVTGGADHTMEVDLFTAAQYLAWTQGTSNAATKVWTGQTAGAGQGAANLPAGWYALVFSSPEAGEAHALQWARNPTREDVAEDALGSIYAALQSLKTTYSNIPASFFDGFQHVRRASEVLSALSANCLDGSLLFASTLELLGLEPVVILETGHAYVGLRSAPGSNVVWPVETTMVGTSTFDDAFTTALGEVAQDSVMDPKFQLIAIKDLRAKGLLPQPQ